MRDELIRAATPVLFQRSSPDARLTAHTPGNSAAPRVTSSGCAFCPTNHEPIALPAPAPDRLIQAKPTHLQMVMDLQKKFSNQLGFLPKVAIAWYLENALAGIALENGQPAGYVLGRPSFRYQRLLRPITQAAVYMDAQRRHHGLALVAAICHKAADAGQVAVQASCAMEIDATDFWLGAGFLPIGSHKPENARGREIVVFRRLLTPATPAWFFTMPPYSGNKARKSPTPSK